MITHSPSIGDQHRTLVWNLLGRMQIVRGVVTRRMPNGQIDVPVSRTITVQFGKLGIETRNIRQIFVVSSFEQPGVTSVEPVVAQTLRHVGECGLKRQKQGVTTEGQDDPAGRGGR